MSGLANAVRDSNSQLPRFEADDADFLGGKVAPAPAASDTSPRKATPQKSRNIVKP